MKSLLLADHLTAEATRILREELLKILGYPFGLPVGAQERSVQQLLTQVYNERVDSFATVNRYAAERDRAVRDYNRVCRDMRNNRTGYEGMP